MKRISIFLGAGILILSSMVYAVVPQLINFQGILRDGSGNPVANGSYSVVFTIYDAPAGGNIVWTETQSVTTTSGLFTVLLGSVSPVLDSIFNDSSRYLGVQVGADPEMTPRQRLSSVGYSYNSSEWTSAAQNLFRLSGNVGIGTATPSVIVETQTGIDQYSYSHTNGTIKLATYLNGFYNSGMIGTVSDHPFQIYTSNFGPVMTLTTGGTSGNVGIGTTSPSEKLDVSGSVKGTSLIAAHDSVPFVVVKQTAPSLNRTPNTWTIWANTFGGLNIQNQTSSFGGDISIDSNHNVGIGTFFPTQRLDVWGSSGVNAYIRTRRPSASNAGGLVLATGSTNQWILLHPGNGTENLQIWNSFLGSAAMTFEHFASNVGIGDATPDFRLDVQQAGTVAGFDRTGSDGTILMFQRDAVQVGTISVAAGVVSYNAFTGSHYGWTEEKLERGELVSLTGLNRNSHDNPKSEIIYGIKRSSAPNDPACLGSYLALGESSKPANMDNPHLVMAVGNGDMWVVDEGQNIQPGDYLISSGVPGHAMKDDEERFPIGHIVARAAEAVDWSSVGETVGGRKHKKISVLFGNFVRSNVASVNRLLEQQRMEIEQMKGTLKQIQAEKPQAKVE